MGENGRKLEKVTSEATDKSTQWQPCVVECAD